jgi:hypothetical protein
MALLLSVLLPTALAAQHAQPDSGKTRPDSARPAPKPDSVKPAPKPAPAPALNFSGVLYGNYQYHGEAANKAQNSFNLERAYLTFRMPAGDRASIRITADVFQQTSSTNNADAYYKGWVFRAKYAYLQYDYLQGKTSADWSAVARAGLIHTMFIDHEETFWPRWLSLVPVERAGYFSSADAGVATIVTIPNKYGELYAAVTNGPGYASRETDRFKDYQARLTLTPLSASDVSYLRTFAIDGWVYRGAIASKFVNGGAGQVGPVGSGLDRNRWGVFAGIKDPRLIVGVDYAQRNDGGEGSSLNTVASPRVVTDSTGSLLSGYAVVKPFQMADATSSFPLGLVARWDHVKPNTSRDADYNVVIAGLTWDLSKKSSISLDYQEQTPRNTTAVAPTRVYFLHWVANF